MAADYVKIGGRTWNVRIVDIEESFEITDTDNAGRVIKDGEMKLDRIGTFFNHSITFVRDGATLTEYDDLFTYLSQPRNSGIPVEFVHNQQTIKYDAYVSNGKRKLLHIDAKLRKVYWDSMTINFISMKTQVPMR